MGAISANLGAHHGTRGMSNGIRLRVIHPSYHRRLFAVCNKAWTRASGLGQKEREIHRRERGLKEAIETCMDGPTARRNDQLPVLTLTKPVRGTYILSGSGDTIQQV